MDRISSLKHNAIVRLRKMGKSIPEISRETGIAITTVQRHVKEVTVPIEFRQILKEKQGGSKERALALRKNIFIKARKIIGVTSPRDRLFLLLGLYWGEGAKRDFSIINSDPLLLQTFITCLRDIDIQKNRLAISVRVHDDMSLERAKIYWSHNTGLPKHSLKYVEIVKGKKKGKLPHGMCRVRVRSGIKDRLFIQSSIAIIGQECRKQVLSR